MEEIMSYNKNKRKQPEKEQKYPLGLLLPIIAFLAFIPLIMMMHDYNTNLDQFEWFTAYASTTDFFLYYKMVWIIGACVYLIFCLLYLFFAEEKNPIWTKKLIPIAVYCGLAFISAIASKYSYFSFHGIFEQFESVWVLVGYGLIVYYSFFIMQSEAALKRTMNWFMIGIAIMSFIGLTQVFRHDIFRTTLGQKLITPSSYTGGPLQFNFELGRPYMTLYNPNYVGFYAALTIPVILTILFAVRKIWLRIASVILLAALVLILFASQSRAGMLALVFSLFIMLLCMRKVFIKNWKIGLAGILLMIAAFFLINKMNDNVLITRLQGMFTTADEYYALKEIQTNNDDVTVVYQSADQNAAENGKITKNDKLVMKMLQDENGADYFELKDGNGKKVDFSLAEDGATYRIGDSRFPFTFGVVRDDSFQGFYVTIDGNQWYLSNLMNTDGQKGYYCRGGAGAMMKLASIKESVAYLDKHYKLANMRGYIWDRTIPLLKKYFLLGSGPDTFIIAFPNNDLVGMYNSGHVNEIITKPHCMYLQVGVQTGVPSLIALLVFFGWYLIDSLRIYWKCHYSEYMTFIGVGILGSVIGYLIISLTNDSCVALSPIFYALIGIGLGINYKIRKDMTFVFDKPAAATVKTSDTNAVADVTGKESAPETKTSTEKKSSTEVKTTTGKKKNKKKKKTSPL